MGVSVEHDDSLHRRFASRGSRGFVEAVRHALAIRGHDYLLTSAIPLELTSASGFPTVQNAQFDGGGGDLRTAEKSMLILPPTIIYQFEQNPARRKKATGIGPGGGSRNRDGVDLGFSQNPLPVGVDGNDEAYVERPSGHLANMIGGDRPLWDSLDQVPKEMLPDLIDKDGNIREDAWVDLTGFLWDEFVTFVVVGPQDREVEYVSDLLFNLLLTTFHRRKMAGNLSGWPYQRQSGAPNMIGSRLKPWMASESIMWQLRTQTVYAEASEYVDRIRVEVHGGNSLR